jgi:hypothetical protein
MVLGSVGQGGLQLAVQQAAVAQASQVVGQCLVARLGQRAHLPEGQRGADQHRQQRPGREQDGQGRDALEVGEDQHADRADANSDGMASTAQPSSCAARSWRGGCQAAKPTSICASTGSASRGVPPWYVPVATRNR